MEDPMLLALFVCRGTTVNATLLDSTLTRKECVCGRQLSGRDAVALLCSALLHLSALNMELDYAIPRTTPPPPP